VYVLCHTLIRASNAYRYHWEPHADLVDVASTAAGDGVDLSPVLLQRARAIAAEHQHLSTANAENYDVAVAKKIGELGPVVAALKEWEDAQSVSSTPLSVYRTTVTRIRSQSLH
jgi:hypothetical protein